MAKRLEDRFEAKVDRSGEHHLWTGAKRADGAGHLKVDGRVVTAHRVAWELAHGPVPTGAQVLACPEERCCVRVDHLSVRQAEQAAPERGRRESGSGSLRQVRAGVWKLTVTVGRYEDGRVRREYFTIEADSRVEAERERAALVAELDASRLPDRRSDRDLTVDEAVELYLHHLRHEKGRELRTVAGYRDVYQKWWADLIGHRRLRDIDTAAMDQGFGRMRTRVGRDRMNHARSLFVPLFRWAQHRKIIRHLPIAQGYELPKSTRTSNRRVPPEVDQLAAYLAASLEVIPDMTPLLTLIATTGMRRSETVVLRRSSLDPADRRLVVEFAADLDGSLKRTKTDEQRSFALDPDTVTMLERHIAEMDQRAELFGVAVVADAFLFSLSPDCATAMPAEYFTKQVAKLKDHLGIPDKRPETIALEDEALRLFRLPPQPRPPGRRGPKPKGGMSYDDIGQALDRSGAWAKQAVTSARRREELAAGGNHEHYDGSIVALRKFSSSELLDAGFNVKVAADRQGHTPETLLRHYAKRRDSADTRAAEHLGRVVHRKHRPNSPEQSL
jgi:integrase